MEHASESISAKFGLAGFLLSIFSLVVLLIQISAFFEPQEQSAGTTIGEIAADIRQSTTRILAGEPAPDPVPVPPDFGLYVTIAALCVAGLAMVLGGIGLYRNEPHRLSYMAVGFGISAFMMHFVFWLAILICGIILLVSIIENLGGVFG